VELCDGLVPSPAASESGLTPAVRRMMAAIVRLAEAEREAFDMVWIQGMTRAEAARVPGVSVITAERWLNRGFQPPAASRGDLCRGDEEPDASC
jgi:RNA polymerase sigma-70 factor (ECF subfamily)